jgi:hypothetical protein
VFLVKRVRGDVTGHAGLVVPSGPVPSSREEGQCGELPNEVGRNEGVGTKSCAGAGGKVWKVLVADWMTVGLKQRAAARLVG